MMKYFNLINQLLTLLTFLCQMRIALCLQLVNRHHQVSPGSSPYHYNFNGANIIASHHSADSDLENYSDEAYSELSAEYEDNLRMSANANARNQHDADDYGKGETKDTSKSERDEVVMVEEEESYEETAARLNCDNPWFWNAPKCTWLDVHANNVIKRTRSNAKTTLWLIGTSATLFISWLCGTYCLYLIKMRNRNKIESIRQKYVPGRIELPNGKVARYQPNQEEIDAYEELVKAIILQEMASMV